MRTVINIFLSLLVVGTLLGFSTDASAETITVQVRSIAASTKGDGFDSKLSDLKGKLKKAFAGYSSFKLAGDTSFRLEEKGKKSLTLPNGSAMTVTFHGTAGRFIKLGLGIAGKLNTTLRATSGSTFFQAGLDYKGGILILAITVK